MVRMAILGVLAVAVACGSDGDPPTGQNSTRSGPPAGTATALTGGEVVPTPGSDAAPLVLNLDAALRGCINKDEAACAQARAAARATLDDLTAEQYFGIAHIYYNGLGGDRDVLVARDKYDKACAEQYAQGCTMLGVLYEKGESGGRADPKTAADYYRRGCDAGDGNGCFRHALSLETGTSGATKPALARTRYRAACDASIPEGCNNLGAMLRDGEGGDANPADARAVFKRGCDGQFGLACANLGMMHANGLGGPKDLELGKKFISSACKLGNARACAIERAVSADAGPAKSP